MRRFPIAASCIKATGLRRQGQYAAHLPDMGPFRDPRNDFAGHRLSNVMTRPTTGSLMMKLAKTVLAGAMVAALGSAALAQEPRTGTVTVLDRLNGSITIQQPQSGTTGANAEGVVERFKIPLKMLDNVHAGDKVKFSVTEANNTKTITKIEAQ
ncbi:MAG: copper-binding protein [Xanthobacteraceae bacterium]